MGTEQTDPRLAAPQTMAEATGAEPSGEALAPLEDAEVDLLRRQLRGVRAVDLRQFGGQDAFGDKVAEMLTRQGFEVSLSRIERMVPAPLRRVVVRYRGNSRAEVTVAPGALRSPVGRI